MGKKTFSIAYQPARLVMGASRWYIVWYAPHFDKDWHRYRETFNLNRIFDLRLRKKRGESLVDKINWWLDEGLPAWEFSERGLFQIQEDGKNKLEETNAKEAIQMIIDLKVSSLSSDSARSYKSIGGLFLNFLDVKGWGSLQIWQISRRHSVAYLDSCVLDRKVGNTTYNNNIRTLRIIFNELISREYIKENPFNQVALKPKPQKLRRNFSSSEAKIVGQYLHKNDPTLFLALLFQYCCYLRPKEIRFLRFSDVNMKDGVVFISRSKGKTKRDRYMTIPDEFRPFFDPDFFNKWPGSYYIFGEEMKPHPTIAVGKGAMYKRHKKILHRLKNEGKLDNIDGLQWYSWKDTGITDALDDLPLLSVQDQAGHTTPKMTLKYRHQKKINQPMRSFKNKIL